MLTTRKIQRRHTAWLCMAAILAGATVLGFILYAFDICPNSIQTIYIFAVFLITRKTKGYWPGIIASGISILLLNFFFFHPHFVFNFIEDGHIIATLCMLAICILTSTLVTRSEVVQANEIQLVQEKAQREIELEKERTRADLLRSISHDLRTPLTSIAGCARTVMENYEVLSKEQKLEMYTHICEDAERLIPMVENVLIITKVQGDLTLTKEEEAAEDIIASAVVRFQKQYPDIKVVTNTPQEVLLVPMDATMIVQVLLNIMYNSVEHGEKTTSIWLTVCREENFAVFTIEDDGVGFSEEKMEHQIKDGRSRNLGIGLECCRTIVLAHGGTSGHRNREEGGAYTYFRLPLDI